MVSLGRKNYLFFGSDHGGERGALLYSLIGTCKPVSYTHLTGDSYDNAMAESINGLYKAEVIHRKSCLLYTSRCV